MPCTALTAPYMEPEDRLALILASTVLGPLAEFHGSIRELSSNGIVEAVCTCGLPRCMVEKRQKDGSYRTVLHIPAKHPVALWNWQGSATEDHGIITASFLTMPEIGFAVVTGVKTVVLDLDIRGEKDGVSAFIRLCEEYGQEFPRTVTVLSGSGEGSLHLYFNATDRIADLHGRESQGIDFLRGGRAAITPGSTHESGDYYRFAEGLSPAEVAVIDVPEWLIEALRNTTVASGTGRKRQPSKDPYQGPASIDAFWDYMISNGPPADARRQPGRRIRKDAAVLWKMHKVPMRRYQEDRSRSDFHWAWTLARYCCHHWDQYIRLWRYSSIRTLPNTKCGYPAYEYSVLRSAYRIQDQQYESHTKRLSAEKTRHPALARKMVQRVNRSEFPRSEATQAVLDLNKAQPHLTPKEMAAILNIEGRLGLTMTANNIYRIKNSYKF